MNRRAKIPDAKGPGAWDPSYRHTYCAEKAGYYTLHTSLLTSPSSTPPPSTTVTHRAESAYLLDLLPEKLQLQDSSASHRAWAVPIFGTKKASWTLPFLLEKQVWHLKGQGSPHRPANPDMFECNDYLRFDLEHPRQAARLQVSVADDLANNGTAFKFTCVEFRRSAAAKKWRAFRRDGADRPQAETKRQHPPVEQTRSPTTEMIETDDFLGFDLEHHEQAIIIHEPPLPLDSGNGRYERPPAV
ncbi:hypothetical protein FANTH_8403 [Fusarium anthophilum]|uniref:Uncharacterized protein n=1 Tax=Fusarium anthophilum TaxID=48485 RepID=A0A8H4Z9Z1_9HYPO|nr:hypothetical protein FANTH_8403 [Fusarium anthophilum]